MLFKPIFLYLEYIYNMNQFVVTHMAKKVYRSNCDNKGIDCMLTTFGIPNHYKNLNPIHHINSNSIPIYTGTELIFRFGTGFNFTPTPRPRPRPTPVGGGGLGGLAMGYEESILP
jgi:hypothetical protein